MFLYALFCFLYAVDDTPGTTFRDRLDVVLLTLIFVQSILLFLVFIGQDWDDFE